MGASIPLWKKWLSHFVDIHLESVDSDFNEDMYVCLSKGRFQLVTKNAVYSYDDLYVNFREAFQQLEIQQKAPKNVLLLGLGLGSIPFMLERIFNVQSHYTAVEIDEAVIYLANKYSLSKLESPIEYICADASSFMASNREKYDLICMDIFEDDFIPPQFETLEYLEQLKASLSPNGMLLYNRLALLKEDVKKTKKFKEEKFKEVFPNGHHLDIKGNWILVGKR